MAGNETPPPVSAAEAMERLGTLSLRELSMDDLLQTVVDLAKTVMPGNPEASVTLVVKGVPSTVVSTGQLAVDVDEKQYARGRGPCLDAARTGQLTEIADAAPTAGGRTTYRAPWSAASSAPSPSRSPSTRTPRSRAH